MNFKLIIKVSLSEREREIGLKNIVDTHLENQIKERAIISLTITKSF